MFKRVFSRKRTLNVSKSIRCSKAMWDAIELLANKEGETANSYVVYALDQFLQEQVKQGKIQPPSEDDEQKAA